MMKFCWENVICSIYIYIFFMKFRLLRLQEHGFTTIICVLESMLLVYCFVNHRSYEDAILDCSIQTDMVMSSKTVADYYSFCREVCVAAVDACHEESKIGGLDILF